MRPRFVAIRSGLLSRSPTLSRRGRCCVPRRLKGFPTEERFTDKRAVRGRGGKTTRGVAKGHRAGRAPLGVSN